MNKVKSLFFMFFVVLGISFTYFSTSHAAETYTYTCSFTSEKYGTSNVTFTYDFPLAIVVGELDGAFGNNTGSTAQANELYLFTNANSYQYGNFTKIAISGHPTNTSFTTWNVLVNYPALGTGCTSIGSFQNFTTNIPMFSSLESARAYLTNGDDSGQLNKIDYSILVDEQPFVEGNMDFSATDTFFLQDYYLDGFFADFDINARWKGVHIPNKLAQWYDKGSIDITKKEVAVMFTYIHKEFYTDTFVKYYPQTFNVDDLECSINVSDFAPDDENYYLSKVSFIPIINITYYNSGMGVSVTPNVTYYGSMSHVNFDTNGSAAGSDFNSGDINGNTDGGYGLGDDDYNGIGGITGDINDTMDTFADTLTGLSSVGSKISGLIGTFFGWLPWWATSLIGCAIGAAVLLRFLGR